MSDSDTSMTTYSHSPSAELIKSLTFKESLDPKIYAAAAMEFAVSTVNRVRSPGAGAALSAAAVRDICERNAVLVGLDRNLSKRLRDNTLAWGTKGGQKTADVVDGSGRFVGKATQIETGAKVARTAATAALIVVEVSHMIAGADMAKMQRETVDKLDRLDAYREIEQESELQALYHEAGELLRSNPNRVPRDKIRDIRTKLHILRIRWRLEAKHNLGEIKDSRNNSKIWNVFKGQESLDEAIKKKIGAEIKKFFLIEYALRLDHSLGLASGTWDESKPRMEEEMKDLDELAELLRDKCSYISDKRRDGVIGLQKSLKAIPPYYQDLISSEPAGNTERLLLEFDSVRVDRV